MEFFRKQFRTAHKNLQLYYLKHVIFNEEILTIILEITKEGILDDEVCVEICSSMIKNLRESQNYSDQMFEILKILLLNEEIKIRKSALQIIPFIYKHQSVKFQHLFVKMIFFNKEFSQYTALKILYFILDNDESVYSNDSFLKNVDKIFNFLIQKKNYLIQKMIIKNLLIIYNQFLNKKISQQNYLIFQDDFLNQIKENCFSDVDLFREMLSLNFLQIFEKISNQSEVSLFIKSVLEKGEHSKFFLILLKSFYIVDFLKKSDRKNLNLFFQNFETLSAGHQSALLILARHLLDSDFIFLNNFQEQLILSDFKNKDFSFFKELENFLSKNKDEIFFEKIIVKVPLNLLELFSDSFSYYLIQKIKGTFIPRKILQIIIKNNYYNIRIKILENLLENLEEIKTQKNFQKFLVLFKQDDIYRIQELVQILIEKINDSKFKQQYQNSIQKRFLKKNKIDQLINYYN